MRKRLSAVLTFALLLTGFSAVAAPTDASAAPAATVSSSASSVVTKTSTKASTTLKKLVVKGKAAATGYSRTQFGTAWKDVDKNKCDTRNDVLARDLTHVKYLDKKKCVVGSGRLADPFTGKTIKFTRGQTTSMAVQIDHLVPLHNSWLTGAQKWSKTKREAFANDPLNLLAVAGSANQQKGSGDAATWLPKNKKYRCPYVARQISVKGKYGLSVTKAEKAALGRVLKSCSKQTTYASKLAVPKTTTKAAVYIGKLKSQSVASGKKVTVKPRVSSTGKTSVKSKTVTVKKGTKTLVNKKKYAKLGVGTYKVTTTVKYKTKSGSTWSKTKAKSKTQTLKITKKKSAAPPKTTKPYASGECPKSAPIKGNQGRPEWIYHMPGGSYYKRTKAEECFSSESAAQKAGYRASKA